jgi:5-methylcytosine-specific restriction endonuclease McrA
MSGRFYSTANWQKIAKAQLAREPICQGCEAKPATVVDHIKPITPPRFEVRVASKSGAKRRVDPFSF